MLRLRIENFDKLPNGGPLEYSVDRRGFDCGRDQHLDWSLPDKSRVISGKHCEIRYYDDAYWLFDVSTNGTFINGSAKRMQSPYRLNDGDRLSIGDYVVSVSVSAPQIAVASPPPSPMPTYATPPAVRSSEGIWDAPVAGPPPIDPRDLMPAPPQHERAADFLNHAAYVPPVIEPEPVRKPRPAASSADLWSSKSAVGSKPSAFDEPSPIAKADPHPEPSPRAKEKREITDSDLAREFIRRFAAGAGISPEAFANANAGDLAEETGRLLNVICAQLMALLHVRAEAKALSRSGNRTLIQQAENNPLKFMPTAEEALRVMLGPQNKGYLNAMQTLDETFGDLKHHQIASLAAMQAAISQVFDDLSPESIAKAAEAKKSLLGSGKSKQWDTFAERWAARAGRREHGMLGAFLELYAEHYDRLSKRKP